MNTPIRAHKTFNRLSWACVFMFLLSCFHVQAEDQPVEHASSPDESLTASVEQVTPPSEKQETSEIAAAPQQLEAQTLPETQAIPYTQATLPEAQVALSVEELKNQVIKLNRDLFILEEDLLFPANTQLVVYVSFATGKFFDLDSLSLKVDDEIVASHLYTKRQLKALSRGGMQRLHLGNLKTGEHEITAVAHGKGPNNKDYKLAVSQVLNKGTDQLALEIRIEDSSNTYQPEMSLTEWDN